MWHKKHYIYIRRTLGRLQKVDEKGHLVKKEKGTPSTEIVVRSPKSELSILQRLGFIFLPTHTKKTLPELWARYKVTLKTALYANTF